VINTSASSGVQPACTETMPAAAATKFRSMPQFLPDADVRSAICSAGIGKSRWGHGPRLPHAVAQPRRPIRGGSVGPTATRTMRTRRDRAFHQLPPYSELRHRHTWLTGEDCATSCANGQRRVDQAGIAPGAQLLGVDEPDRDTEKD
jgi:hypothetical protein